MSDSISITCVCNICWIIPYDIIPHKEMKGKTVNVLFKLFKVKTNQMFLNTGAGENIT